MGNIDNIPPKNGALAPLDQVDTPQIVDKAVTIAKNAQFSANGEAGSTIAMVNFVAAPVTPVNGTFWFSEIGGLTYINYHIGGVTKSVELS